MTPVWHTVTGVADRWPCEIVIPDRDGVVGDTRGRTTADPWASHFVLSHPVLSEDERIWIDYVHVYETRVGRLRRWLGPPPLIRWEVRYCYAPEGWAPGPAAGGKRDEHD